MAKDAESQSPTKAKLNFPHDRWHFSACTLPVSPHSIPNHFDSISFHKTTHKLHIAHKFKIYISLKCNSSIFMPAIKLCGNEWKPNQTKSSWFQNYLDISLRISTQSNWCIYIYLFIRYSRQYSATNSFDFFLNVCACSLPLSLPLSQFILICISKCFRACFVPLQLFDCYICTCAWNSIGFDSARLYLRLPSYVWWIREHSIGMDGHHLILMCIFIPMNRFNCLNNIEFAQFALQPINSFCVCVWKSRLINGR